MTSTLTREAARAKFFELREAEGLVDDAVLDTVWAGLATLRPEEMLGAWKGGEFTTGHAINGGAGEGQLVRQDLHLAQ